MEKLDKEILKKKEKIKKIKIIIKKIILNTNLKILKKKINPLNSNYY